MAARCPICTQEFLDANAVRRHQLVVHGLTAETGSAGWTEVPGPKGEPGWHADPWNASKLRWWDGRAWSGNTMPLPEQPAAEPAATAPAAWGEAPVAPQPPAPGPSPSGWQGAPPGAVKLVAERVDGRPVAVGHGPDRAGRDRPCRIVRGDRCAGLKVLDGKRADAGRWRSCHDGAPRAVSCLPEHAHQGR